MARADLNRHQQQFVAVRPRSFSRGTAITIWKALHAVRGDAFAAVPVRTAWKALLEVIEEQARAALLTEEVADAS